LIVAIGAAALAASVALFVPAARTLASAISPIASLQQTLTTPAQRSYVYDRNGNLMTTLFDVDRAPVKLSAVSEAAPGGCHRHRGPQVLPAQRCRPRRDVPRVHP